MRSRYRRKPPRHPQLLPRRLSVESLEARRVLASSFAGLDITPNPAQNSDLLTLSPYGIVGDFLYFSYYQDANGDGVLSLEGDREIGSSNNAFSTPPFKVVTTALGLAPGYHRFFAVGLDFNANRIGRFADVLIETPNSAPSISSLSASPNPVGVGSYFTLTANGVSDPDGSSDLDSVAFYRESNGQAGLQISGSGVRDSLVDTDDSSSGSWKTELVAPSAAGQRVYYAVARDDAGALSSAVQTTVTFFENLPPTIGSLTAAPNPATVGQAVTITANNVNDPDGVADIDFVQFFLESNGQAGFQGTDTSLGSDPSSTNGWAIALTPTTAGTLSLYARAFDKGFSDSNVVTTTLTVQPAVVPEIDVRFGGQPIVDGDVTPSTADGTDFGAVGVGVALLRTFTIANTGTSTLTLGGTPRVAISGGSAADFTVTTQPAAGVTAGGTTTFTIGFTPSAAGSRQATISIANDDADENPYNFSILGTGIIIAPEIDLRYGSQTIADGDATPSAVEGTDFGAAAVGVAVARTFTIANTGNCSLALAGTPHVAISGANAADFTVTTQPATSVAAGGTTTFTVRFTPSAAGSRQATISIANDDADENPYNFSILGTGTIAPEIDLRYGSQTIADGDSTPSAAEGTDFGAAAVGLAVSRNFTIANTGTGSLALGGSPRVAISGLNAADFTVTTQPAVSVSAGGTTTFTVRFTPSAVGARQATILIANDDADEGPYDFVILGMGLIPAPDIDVTGKGRTISDGSTVTSTETGTDFGVTSLSSPWRTTVVYTITNVGSATLNLGTISLVAFVGSVSHFTIREQPNVVGPDTTAKTSLLPSEQAEFRVSYLPAAPSFDSATVSIPSNDPDENPFDFLISGRTQSNLLGDANGDGTVGSADYAIWAAEFGRTGSNLMADFDGDGSVGAADYALWAANFGRTSGGGAAASFRAATFGGIGSATTATRDFASPGLKFEQAWERATAALDRAFQDSRSWEPAPHWDEIAVEQVRRRRTSTNRPATGDDSVAVLLRELLGRDTNRGGPGGTSPSSSSTKPSLNPRPR